MVGCAICEDWFHIACLGLAPCSKHLPPPGVTAVVCLVESGGHHINVSGEYVCPACSHTTWGTGAAKAQHAHEPAGEGGVEAAGTAAADGQLLAGASASGVLGMGLGLGLGLARF